MWHYLPSPSQIRMVYANRDTKVTIAGCANAPQETQGNGTGLLEITQTLCKTETSSAFCPHFSRTRLCLQPAPNASAGRKTKSPAISTEPRRCESSLCLQAGQSPFLPLRHALPVLDTQRVPLEQHQVPLHRAPYGANLRSSPLPALVLKCDSQLKADP